VSKIQATPVPVPGNERESRNKPCKCLFAGADWHDELLHLEDGGAPVWERLLDPGAGPELSEAVVFISQHNWRDPAAMGLVQEHLNDLYNDQRLISEHFHADYGSADEPA